MAEIEITSIDINDQEAVARAAKALRDREPNPRIEFLKLTKEDIGNQAGWKCCYFGCLIETTCAADKDDGTIGSAKTGVAAHIYAARRGGPRWNENLTKEQIAHSDNGVWMCAYHGDVIDVFEKEHPPEALCKMRDIRRFGQKMTILDVRVGRFVKRNGVEWLDDIVRKHWPELDPAKIAQDIVILDEIFERQNSLASVSLGAPPPSLLLNTLANAVKTALAQTTAPALQIDLTAILAEREARERSEQIARALDQEQRRRIAQIVMAWAKHLQLNSFLGRSYLFECDVLIGARNPATGEVGDARIWAEASSKVVHTYSVEEGEHLSVSLTHTYNDANNLDWRLDVELDGAGCKVTSTLQITSHVGIPKQYRNVDWHSLEQYAAVLTKLVEGWEPVGYVGLKTESLDPKVSYHASPFEIKAQYALCELKECLKRYKKLEYSHELALEHGLTFIPTHDYFCDELRCEAIRDALEEMAESSNYIPYWYMSLSKPLARVALREIRLSINNFIMTFVSHPISQQI